MTGTGVDVFIGEGPDRIPYWSSGAFTIVEDSTPVDPSDSSGGYGQITTVVYDEQEVRGHSGKRLDLVDGQQGETTGTIRGLSGNGIAATIVADSRLALTAVKRQAQPFIGTLGNALRYYLGLCGITSGIVVDPALESKAVQLLGWNGVVYDQLKKLGPVHRFEMSLVSNNVVFRPVRGRVAVDYRDAQRAWVQDESNLAQRVEGYSYGVSSGTQLAYPIGGWNQDVTVYVVDAGQTTEIDIPLEASLTSVSQPTCVAFVDRYHSATSVYSVSGNDGIAIQPAQWAAGGGSVTVAIGEDTRSLKVTITASSETQYSPYRIGVSAGTSDWYSSLRLRATGVFYSKKLMSLPACLDPDRAPQEVGATVDNEFFENEDDLYHALLWSAARFGTPRMTINVTTKGINRVGDSGSARYPTIGDVEAIFGAATIATRFTQLGPTIKDWDDTLFALVRDDFENQAFGNVGGARVERDGAWYRIRSATIAPAQVQYSAEWDTVIGDLPVETIAQWEARWAGRTIADVDREPLARA
ncbi:hypothetical protein [Streptomyces sp. AC495_CC817]|uniref:hypothetical protein n=1 Tax=Streptomyces sp. AC495_CC817 TaxID=2823900 RepID=UPI001C2613BC|nr:hypothetical protein [Streptomyces sp. AC495_CC817]